MPMIVLIPCTRLTRCILATEHGTAPIKVSRSHFLWPFLRPHSDGDKIRKSHLVADRSATFAIDVPGELGELLLREGCDAGISLHKYHVDRMMRHMLAAGPPYRAALRNFQEVYSITDDDYDLDSAYRMWVRFSNNLEKKIQKPLKISPSPVLIFSRAGSLRKTSDEDLRKFITFVTRRLRYLRPDLPKYVFRQVAIYLTYDYGQRSYKEVMEQFDKSHAAVYNAVNKIKGYIDVDEDFARLVSPEKLFQNACKT